MSVVEAIRQRAFKQMDFDRRLYTELTDKAGAACTPAEIEQWMPELELALGASPFALIQEGAIPLRSREETVLYTGGLALSSLAR